MRKAQTLRIFIIAGLLIFSSAILAIPTITPPIHASAQTDVPTITLSQSSGPSGAVITVSGSGFGYENDLYSIDICCSYLGSVPVPSAPYYCLPNGAGSFSCEYGILNTNSEYFCTIPTIVKQIECIIHAAQGALPFPPGKYTVEVHSEVSVGIKSIPTQSASSPFTITGGPTVTLSKTSGPWGTYVTASGSGYSPTDSYVEIFLESQSSTTTFSLLAPCSFGGSCFSQTTPTFTSGSLAICSTTGGAFSGCGFKIPSGIAAAPYYVTAVGNALLGATDDCGGCDTGQALFEVDAAITITPAAGPVGTPVSVNGSGFGYYTGNLATQTYVSDYSVYGTEDGLLFGGCSATVSDYKFSCSFNEQALSTGLHTITECGAQGECAAATFEQTTAGFTISPTYGPATTPVTVSGSGFSHADTSAQITFGGSPVSDNVTPQTGCPMTSGSFSCTFAVPTNLPNYEYNVPVTVTGEPDGDNYQSLGIYDKYFYITFPTLGVSQPSDTVGTQVTAFSIEGGFSPTDTSVQLTLGGINITPPSCPMYQSSFSCVFTVPQLPPGTYTLTAQGNTGGAGDSASVSFKVVPSITLSPTSNYEGSQVTVTGSNFSPSDSLIQLQFDKTPLTFSSGVCTPSSSGSFSCSFSVPYSVSAGSHTVTATGTSGDSASAPFSVLTPQISLAPSNGGAGSIVTVSSTQFSSGDTSASITFGGVNVGSCSLIGGSLYESTSLSPCTFFVPLQPVGTPTVTVTGNLGDSGSSVFSLNSMVLHASSGPVGAEIGLIVNGFSKSASSASIAFDGIAENSCQMYGNGQLNCDFTVQSVSLGSYIVSATDNLGETAYATFRVTAPDVSISPSVGPRGTQVTINGSGFRGDDYSFNIEFFPPYSLGTSIGTCPGAGGSFSCQVTIPSDTGYPGYYRYPPGSYDIVVTGFNYEFPDSPVSTTFNITSQSLSLSPTSGPVGTVVTASGRGLSLSDSSVSLNMDSIDVTPPAGCPIVDDGFSCSLIVPNLVPGSYVVTATGNTGDSVQATFAVTIPSITASPSPALSGQSVTIKGAGYPSNDAAAIILLNGADVTPSSGCPLIGGSFTCQITLPQISTATTFNIIATGSAGDSASTTLSATVPTVTIAQSVGSIGSTFTITGFGFNTSDSSLAFTFSGSVITPAGSCAPSSGSFTCTLVVPPGAQPGTDVVVATGNSGDSAKTSFHDIPTLSVEPGSGSVGQVVTISGRGYSSIDSFVSLTFGGIALNPSICPVSDGSFSCSFTVPPIASGNYAIEAIGSSNAQGDLGSSQFAVTNESLSLTQNSGPPGTIVGIFGSGFPAISSYVSVTLSDSQAASTVIPLSSDGTSSCPVAGAAAQITQPGSLTCIFTVPDLPVGTYSLEVNDPNLGVASSTFTVTDPSLSMSLSSNSGPSGISVALTAGPFPTGDNYAQVLFGSTVVNSACPVSSGTGSCSFIVPSSSTGTYTVTAEDQYGNTAVAKFTLTVPLVSSVPLSAPEGSDIGVFGSGFSSSDTPIDISIGGMDVTTSASCSASQGYFSCAVAVPNLIAGQYTITATGQDGSTDSASASFTVTVPEVSLSTAVGSAGTIVNISGSGFPEVESYATVNFGSSQVISLTESGTSNCSIASDGSISDCSFIVPTIASGPYSVTLSDLFGDNASATFTILPPTISLSSGSGTVGSQVQVTGSDFSLVDSSVALTLGTIAITPSGGCLLAGGSFACTIKVPSSSEGLSTITATGAPGGDSAFATFAVATTTLISSFSCAPPTGSVETYESCTAVVSNGDTSYATSPGGTLSFSGALPPGMASSCYLQSQRGLDSSSCSVTWTPAAGTEGDYSIQATYGGDATHEASPTSAVTMLTIQKATSVSSVSCLPNPVTIDNPTTCTVTVTGYAPSGIVTFGTSSATGRFTPTEAQCTLNTENKCTVAYLDTAAVSGITISVSYAGDANNFGSSATTNLTVQYRNCTNIVPNRAGANLKGADLEYCNLASYDMSGDNLMGANMQYTSLYNTTLQGANLMKANLYNTFAPDANFQGANMKGDNLNESNLVGANMQGTNLMGASIAGSNLQGAILTGDNLKGVDLANSNMDGDNLQGDNLQGANLSEGTFTNCNFNGANLQDANMTDGNFSYSNFQGANTQGVITMGADFIGAIDPPS